MIDACESRPTHPPTLMAASISSLVDMTLCCSLLPRLSIEEDDDTRDRLPASVTEPLVVVVVGGWWLVRIGGVGSKFAIASSPLTSRNKQGKARLAKAFERAAGEGCGRGSIRAAQQNRLPRWATRWGGAHTRGPNQGRPHARPRAPHDPSITQGPGCENVPWIGSGDGRQLPILSHGFGPAGIAVVAGAV